VCGQDVEVWLAGPGIPETGYLHLIFSSCPHRLFDCRAYSMAFNYAESLEFQPAKSKKKRSRVNATRTPKQLFDDTLVELKASQDWVSQVICHSANPLPPTTSEQLNML
jgi:hypothetical protein